MTTSWAARMSAAAVLSLALAACSGSSGGSVALSPGAQPTTTPSTASASTEPCTPDAARPAKQPQQFPSEPPLTTKPTDYTATIVTNCGTVVAALDGKNAPHTVNSFAFLASKHYFDGTICHRLTTSGIFVIQCGDPSGTGTGGPGYTIPDENLKGATYPAGTLAMANTGQPHTGGSQFFFCYADTQLPPQYTPFGHVVSGLDVLTKIAQAGSDNSNGQGDGAPNQPLVIASFTVTEGAPPAG